MYSYSQWLLCWIHLLQIVKGLSGEDVSGGYETSHVYPAYSLRQLSPRSKILGIWKLTTRNNQKLAVRTFTEAKENLIKTNCRPVKMTILLHDESPMLPSSLRENEISGLYEEFAPFYNKTLQLDGLNIESNSTNEQIIDIPFNYSTNKTRVQYLTSWYEEESVAELPLKSRIERKFGISTGCQPKIQFNLTSISDSNESSSSSNDPADDEIENELDLTSYEPLSKQTEKEHQAWFYTNVSSNATAAWSCSDSRPQKHFFDIDQDTESGGVLKLKILGANVSLCLSQSNDQCNQSDTYFISNNESFYLPQPKAGQWILDLKNVSCDDESDEAVFNMTMVGCVDECGEYEGRGECQTYYTQGNVIMSSCTCKAGYNGISCSNDENYMSVSLQLLEMLLLTMSNLFFLPAIIIGLYRRYWQETVVYIIAMATSTMYHACDQFSTQKYYCIAEYDTLQYADFLAATAAIWVTVLAIADLPSRWTSLLHTTGILCFAVGAHHNRFSIWLMAAPVIIGTAILITHWIYQCRIRRDCYPTSRTWLCHLLPGLTLAAAGFVTKIVFEFEDEGASNYYYVHTIWHALLGLACAFLLPEVAYDSAKLYNSNTNNLISYYKSFDPSDFEPNAL
jgi:hypothetical protein